MLSAWIMRRREDYAIPTESTDPVGNLSDYIKALEQRIEGLEVENEGLRAIEAIHIQEAAHNAD